VSRSEEQEDEEDESMDDIESSIQREVASMSKKQNHTKLIAPVRLDLQCVLFFKIRPPIEPVDFVHRICKEVVSTLSIRRMKYINRLTPMALMGKATEKGLEEVGRVVLGQHFNLREDQENTMEDESHERRKVESQKIPNHSVSVVTFRFTAPLAWFCWQVAGPKIEMGKS
jgi:tRNA acetyltransferase TAN1